LGHRLSVLIIDLNRHSTSPPLQQFFVKFKSIAQKRQEGKGKKHPKQFSFFLPFFLFLAVPHKSLKRLLDSSYFGFLVPRAQLALVVTIYDTGSFKSRFLSGVGSNLASIAKSTQVVFPPTSIQLTG